MRNPNSRRLTNRRKSVVKTAKSKKSVPKKSGRLCFTGQSFEIIKRAIQEENFSSLELSDNKKVEMYKDLFISSDTTKIKELILSPTMSDLNCDQVEDMRVIFTAVPHLQGLVFAYSKKILRLLEPLQSLQSLTIYGVTDDIDSNLSSSLGSLRSLTQLSIESKEVCYKLLNKLSEKADNEILRITLTQLILHLPCDLVSLYRIQRFKSLQLLTMGPFSCAEVPLGVWRDFPSELRKIQIDGLKVSCNAFFTLIDNLQHLHLLNVGNGDIFADNDLNCRLDGWNVTPLIMEGLKLRHRSMLRILYYRQLGQFGPMREDSYESTTPPLHIIRYVAQEKSSLRPGQ